jgi:hypothetical protein
MLAGLRGFLRHDEESARAVIFPALCSPDAIDCKKTWRRVGIGMKSRA